MSADELIIDSFAGPAARIRALRATVAFGLFQGGCDTADVARVLQIDEPEAVRLVALGREAAE